MVKLSPGADPDAVLAAAEQALGRPILKPRQVKGAGVLSFWANPAELPLWRGVPGVLRAEGEGSVPLPPRPVKQKAER